MELTPLGDNIIIRGTTKKSTILVENKRTLSVDKLIVWKVGEDIKNIKPKQEVLLNQRVLMEAERVVDPFSEKGSVKTEEEFYIVVKPEEIIGIFK